MIHQSKDLTISTTHERYQGVWQPKKQGNGFILEGTLISISNHNIQDSSNNHFRYMKLIIDITLSRKRNFAPTGEELETQYQKEKVQRKGYLTHFDHVEQEDPHAITLNDLTRYITRVSGNQFALLGTAAMIKSADFRPSQKLKLKTAGDSNIIETITAQSQEKFGNFYGENVVGKWDDKILQMKESDDTNNNNSNVEGCADDEWD